MEQKRDLAIVLRSIPYEERHRIVTALTENHGQISGLARNAVQSRRFGGSLEPFAASEWHFTVKPGAELVRIDQAQIRRPFEGLRKDFESLSLASVFGELMLKLAPRDEPAPDLFKLHSNALALLEEQTSPGANLTILNAYLAKLLQWNGSQPRLLACLTCSKHLEELPMDSELSCLIADAGWICAECRGQGTRHLEQGGQGFAHLALRISPAAAWDFHLSLAQPLRQIPATARASRKQHQDLFRFLEALIVYHVPGFDRRPLKALRFLDVESAWRGLAE
jgi:DNA repair protein RecO